MLKSYRVLDLTDDKGQFCGRLLADLGCEVVKIEKPGGDPARRTGPFYHDVPDPEKSLSWFANNRGKKSITLDIETDDGQAAFKDLAGQADVVIESFAPGYLDGLGLGYSRLSELNPRIVMASITPFGQNGPYRDYRGPDIVVSALSGFMGMNGEPDRAPLNSSVPILYPFASAHAAQAVLLALCHRERAGRGQHIDCSMQESVVLNVVDVEYWTEYGLIEGRREGNTYTSETGVVRRFVSPCKDGYVCFFLYGGEHGARSNRELQQWMESEGMASPVLEGMKWEELDFETATPEQLTRICECFDRFFRTRTRAELQQRAVERKILMAPCSTVSDLLESPQLQSRRFWTKVDHPELGETVTYPDTAVISTAFPRGGFVRAPRIGEHNAAFRPGGPSEPGQPGSPGREGGPASSGADGRQALAGLKVLDFTQAMAGPLAARLLADQGATVVHVESETKMDIYRVIPPYKGREPGINRALSFANYNAGKYGISLNMANRRSADVAWRLISWADVVVDSRTPGVLEKWGFGYRDMVKRNPNIILARMTNQGTEGPWAMHPGYGTQVIGQAGMISLVGWPDRDPLMFGRSTYADLSSSGLFTTYLIAAILHRLRTGQGQYLDTSMVECCVNFLTPQVLDYVVNGREISRTGNRRPDAAPHGAFPCRGEDSWCAIAVSSDAEWASLCQAMGRPTLASDPRFATLPARKKNEDQLESEVAAWTRGLSARDVMTTLQEAGVAAGVVEDFREVWEDVQLRHRRHFYDVPHSEMGSHNVFSFPCILSETPCVVARGAPGQGEHNEHVICQLLGYSDEEFISMDSEGVFR